MPPAGSVAGCDAGLGPRTADAHPCRIVGELVQAVACECVGGGPSTDEVFEPAPSAFEQIRLSDQSS